MFRYLQVTYKNRQHSYHQTVFVLPYRQEMSFNEKKQNTAEYSNSDSKLFLESEVKDMITESDHYGNKGSCDHNHHKVS